MKVDWTSVLPLPQHLPRPVQLILVLVFVSSFYIDYQQLQVSLCSNTFSHLYHLSTKFQNRNRETSLQGADIKLHGTIVRLSFHFITSHCLPFFLNAQVENPTRSEHVPSTNEVDVCPEEATWSTSPALAELQSGAEPSDHPLRGLKNKMPSRMVAGRRCPQIKREYRI